MALEDLLKRFPQLGDSFEEARDALVDLLDPQLSKIGLDFERDVDPWLGNQIGLYFMAPEVDVTQEGDGAEPFGPSADPDAAAIVAVTDVPAAEEAVAKVIDSQGLDAEEATYQGTDYSLV